MSLSLAQEGMADVVPLHLLDFPQPFMLSTGASDCTIGATLHQREDKGDVCPLAFFDKS